MSQQKKDDPRSFAGFSFLLMAVGFVLILTTNTALGISFISVGIVLIAINSLWENYNKRK